MFKKTITFLSFAAAILMQAPSAYAVPAKPGVVTMTDAHGKEIEVRIIGDEYAHIYTTPSGVPLSLGADGLFRHAAIDASGEIIPGNAIYDGRQAHLMPADKAELSRALRHCVDRRMASRFRAPGDGPSGFPGLFPGASYPLAGNPKALVILVEYSDVKMSTDNASDYFTRMLNERGFSDYGATGSAADYFFENSCGRFMPQFDVVGPVTLPQPRKYYGGNVMGTDAHAEQMVIEACRLLDSKIDFSVYDTNGDGVIDNVFLFYAGRSEADGGGSDAVWPHSSNITYFGDYRFDGVQLDYYACTNEWQGGRPDGIGTFIHEFSHVMGLPDLYATDYQGAFTPGRWSVLDEGPYNNNGCTPPMYSAFERYSLGWLDPVEIDGPLSATLPTIDSNIAGIALTDSPQEYFLFEYRSRQGWDAFIPGDGMLVWHVDYNAGVWGTNSVNNNPAHQYVDLVEADGVQTSETRAGDSFPGASGIDSFTAHTAPAFKSWSGRTIDLPLTGIKEDGGLLHFNVSGGAALPDAPEALDATDVSAGSFTARWKKCEGKAMLSVWSENTDGSRIPLSGYTDLLVDGDSQIVEGLEASTEYFYSVASYQGLSMSEYSNTIAVVTSMASLGERQVEALPAVDCSSDAFTARWVPLEGAESYILNVYTKEKGEPLQFSLGFDEGVSSLPQGWTSTSAASYSMASMAGNAIPSLRMGAGDVIASCAYPDGISGISFWHRGSATGDDAKISLQVLCGADWIPVGEYPVVTVAGGAVVEAGNIPDGAEAMRISIETGKGAVAIDDITVYHGFTVDKVPFAGFDSFDTGNVDSFIVRGERKGEVYYTVYALAGDEKSMSSDEIKVSPVSGVDTVAAGDFDVKISGSAVCVSGADGEIVIYDMLGRVVCSGKGDGTYILSTRGAYILHCGSISLKIIL